MESKYLYTFSILEPKEEIVEEKTFNEETKEETIVKRKVVNEVPVEFAIKKPNRRQIEDADLEFSVEMSRCIKKGILTKAMLAKKYSDTGGMLSENESQKLVDLYKEVYELQNETIRFEASNQSEEAKEKNLKSLEKLADVRRQIIDIESNYRSLFDHTADSKAQNRILLWYILFLTQVKRSGESNFHPYFKGNDFEDKLESYYQKEENPSNEYIKVSRKLSTLIAFWFFNQASTFEDFKELERKIDSGEL